MKNELIRFVKTVSINHFSAYILERSIISNSYRKIHYLLNLWLCPYTLIMIRGIPILRIFEQIVNSIILNENNFHTNISINHQCHKQKIQVSIQSVLWTFCWEKFRYSTWNATTKNCFPSFYCWFLWHQHTVVEVEVVAADEAIAVVVVVDFSGKVNQHRTVHRTLDHIRNKRTAHRIILVRRTIMELAHRTIMELAHRIPTTDGIREVVSTVPDRDITTIHLVTATTTTHHHRPIGDRLIAIRTIIKHPMVSEHFIQLAVVNINFLTLSVKLRNA